MHRKIPSGYNLYMDHAPALSFSQMLTHWQILQSKNMLSLILSLPAGILIGLLINYLSDVLPTTRRFSRPTCPNCCQAWQLWDYVIGTRCPHCGQRKTLRWAIVFVGTVIICGLLTVFPPPEMGFWAALPLLVFFGVMGVIDSEHRLVLIETSLFGLVLCLVYGVLLHNLAPTLFGGAGGLLMTLLFFLLGKASVKILGVWRGEKANREAFGFGDVFAGSFMGLLTGWPRIVGAILIGLLVFVVFSLVYIGVLLALRRYRTFATVLPVTPFLVIGAVVVLYL